MYTVYCGLPSSCKKCIDVLYLLRKEKKLRNLWNLGS